MKLHKCKVYKVKLWFSSSRKYDVSDYYKIKIYAFNKKQYFYIRNYKATYTKPIPFSTFYKNIDTNNSFHHSSIFICNLFSNNHLISPYRESKQEFYKYIEIYPNIIQLFESKDEYSVRVGLEILKQQLELGIQ